MDNFLIRKANISDLEQIAELEKSCFPPTESATKEILKKRLEKYPEYFFILLISDKIISMVNGMVTDIPDLLDEMYSEEKMHNINGEWQMIFGVDTHPEYRNNGYAAYTLNSFIENARNEKRKGVVLTCKKQLIHYYEKFGFVNEGLSVSNHGGVLWYQMRLKF